MEWLGSLLIVVFCGCIVLRSMCLTNDEKNYDWESMWNEFYKRSDDVTPRDIEESSASAISRRLHLALALAGRVNAFDRRVTVAAIAELIGHSSTQRIESALSGNDVLPFSELDKICDVPGIYREWLLDNAFQAFYQEVKYLSADDFLRALGKLKVRDADGDLYDKVILVLSTDDFGSVAIFGHTHRKPYRLDKLLLGNLHDWDMILVCAITAKSGPVSKLVQNTDFRHGVIFESSDFRKLVDGRVHPGVLMEPSIPYRHWNEDI